MHSLTFLGTGGGRYVLLTQRRHTGGIWLDFEATMILDPGPGALVRALQYGKNPGRLNAVLVSHRHLDHYNDAEIMIEAMTRGMKKRNGILIASENVLEYISDYHREGIQVITPKPGEFFSVKELKVQALPTEKHEEGIGFKFFTEKGVVTYSSDTAYSEELTENYRNSRILILNTIFPNSKPIETHLNTEKAIEILKRAKPEFAVIQHFGMTMLNANPDNEARRIESETGIRTIAARDGMCIDLEKLTLAEKGRQMRLF